MVGEGLDIKCLPYFWSFFASCLEDKLGGRCLYVKKKLNYSLNILKHSRQQDGYSCGAYIIATATSMSKRPSSIPNTTLTPTNREDSTEFLRSLGVSSLLSHILASLESDNCPKRNVTPKMGQKMDVKFGPVK